MSIAMDLTRTRQRSFWFVASIFAAIAAGGFAGCNGSTSKPATADAGKPGSAVAATATSTPRNAVPEKPVVQIDTSSGAITVQLDGVRAPETVRNFLDYVGEGFYENTLVHYVAPGKMILAGGYSTDNKPKATRPP